jgi:hypothetical protein
MLGNGFPHNTSHSQATLTLPLRKQSSQFKVNSQQATGGLNGETANIGSTECRFARSSQKSGGTESAGPPQERWF